MDLAIPEDNGAKLQGKIHRRAHRNTTKAIDTTKANEVVYWVNLNTCSIILVVAVILTACELLSDGSQAVDCARKFLVLVGAILSAIGLVLWVGHVTRVNEIRGAFTKTISNTLIISLLTTSAMTYHSIMTQRSPADPITKLLDPTYIGQRDNAVSDAERFYFTSLKETSYADLTVGRLFPILILTDKEVDSDIQADLELYSSRGEGQPIKLPTLKARDAISWTDEKNGIASDLQAEDKESLVKSAKGKVVFLAILRIPDIKNTILADTLNITLSFDVGNSRRVEISIKIPVK
jgi:hypothetical protein